MENIFESFGDYMETINEAKVKFNFDQVEIDKQIALAKKVGASNGMIPVVTVAKLSPKDRKVIYGFHFEKEGTAKVGDVQNLEDGSIRKLVWVSDN